MSQEDFEKVMHEVAKFLEKMKKVENITQVSATQESHWDVITISCRGKDGYTHLIGLSIWNDNSYTHYED